MKIQCEYIFIHCNPNLCPKNVLSKTFYFPKWKGQLMRATLWMCPLQRFNNSLIFVVFFVLFLKQIFAQNVRRFPKICGKWTFDSIWRIAKMSSSWIAVTLAGAQDPVVKTHCSDTSAFGHGSLRMHSTKPHSDEALYESPSYVFQLNCLQMAFRVLLLNYEYICLDTFILCTLQAKSKHHICIFLH